MIFQNYFLQYQNIIRYASCMKICSLSSFSLHSIARHQHAMATYSIITTFFKEFDKYSIIQTFVDFDFHISTLAQPTSQPNALITGQILPGTSVPKNNKQSVLNNNKQIIYKRACSGCCSSLLAPYLSMMMYKLIPALSCFTLSSGWYRNLQKMYGSISSLEVDTLLYHTIEVHSCSTPH